jgi:hypothetical protein
MKWVGVCGSGRGLVGRPGASRGAEGRERGEGVGSWMRGSELMRGSRFFAGGVLFVAVLLIAVVPASALARGRSLLRFTQGVGEVAPEGAVVYVLLNLGDECISESVGGLGRNPELEVVVKVSALRGVECGAGVSESGSVEEETWRSSGGDGVKLKLKGTIEVIDPGPCVYQYAKFASQMLQLPGVGVFATGEVTGKLNKKSSHTTGCAVKQSKEYLAGVLDVEEKLFGLELA